jgi:diacylglycerol O-acyltransferase
LHPKLGLINKAFGGDQWGDPTVADTIVQGLFYFEELPDADALRQAVSDKILLFPRFRSLITTNPKLPAQRQFLELDKEAVNLDNHIVHRTVGSDAEMKRLIEKELIGKPMDLSIPGWSLWVVKNTGGLSCIILNAHHGIGDGTSFMVVNMQLLTDAAGGKLAGYTEPRKAREARAPAKTLAEKAQRLLKSVGKTLALTAKYIIPVFESLFKITSYVLRGDDDTALHSDHFDRSGKKELIFVPPLSVEGLKALKADMGKGVTLNDVLLGVLSGACRTYMKENGNPGTDAQLAKTVTRVYMPFMLPRKMDGYDLHNKFSLVSVPLAVGEKDPIERIRMSNKAMAKVKNGVEWLVNGRLVKLITTMKVYVNRPFAYWLTRKATCNHTFMFSNVPGLNTEAYLAGARVVDMRFSMGIPTGTACCISHEGQCNFTLNLNPDISPNPQRLGELIVEEVKTLCKLQGVPEEKVLSPPRFKSL